MLKTIFLKENGFFFPFKMYCAMAALVAQTFYMLTKICDRIVSVNEHDKLLLFNMRPL